MVAVHGPYGSRFLCRACGVQLVNDLKLALALDRELEARKVPS